MAIKPYSYNKAKKYMDMYKTKTEYNIWVANEELREAIKRSCFSGLDRASIELTLYSSGFSFDDIYQIETVINDLSDCYEKEGYSICIKELMGASLKIEGYRLTVNW